MLMQVLAEFLQSDILKNDRLPPDLIPEPDMFSQAEAWFLDYKLGQVQALIYVILPWAEAYSQEY